jgi:hypothetical protein
MYKKKQKIPKNPKEPTGLVFFFKPEFFFQPCLQVTKRTEPFKILDMEVSDETLELFMSMPREGIEAGHFMPPSEVSNY